MKIILNDNEFVTEAALTAYDAIKEAGLMTREVIAALLDGETVALTAPITEGCRLAPLTFADKEGKGVFNHTASHILAQAVKRLYPTAKLTIGPSVEDGFYYDVDAEEPFTREALDKLEGEMKKIVKENLKIVPVATAKEALLIALENDPYEKRGENSTDNHTQMALQRFDGRRRKCLLLHYPAISANGL